MTSPRPDDSKNQDTHPALPEGAFRDILQSPDRDLIPGSWPCLSFRSDDDEEFLVPLRERMVGRASLARRGVDHGQVALFEPGDVNPRPPKGRRMRALEKERWVAAQPLFLPGALERELRLERELDERALEDLRRRLLEPAALLPWVRSACRKSKRFRAGEPMDLEDPERDLARVAVGARYAGALREDLWVKSARLSLHAADKSLRVRVSFGSEELDDESRDEAGHRLVAELSQKLLPGARSLTQAQEPRETLERILGRELLFTQPIGYWNAPEGGARMHHDAFGGATDETSGDTLAEDPSGQLGVAYVQLTGKTLWIALSLMDLALRVREFMGWLEDGDAPWVVEESLGGATGLAELLELAGQPEELRSELAREGCGRFGPLVERGSEFTGALVDAGHACFLRPGDVILLPNHGLARTAMHAVFCASPQAGYGLSVAIRAVKL